jgi:hypothetical protein
VQAVIWRSSRARYSTCRALRIVHQVASYGRECMTKGLNFPGYQSRPTSFRSDGAAVITDFESVRKLSWTMTWRGWHRRQ